MKIRLEKCWNGGVRMDILSEKDEVEKTILFTKESWEFFAATSKAFVKVTGDSIVVMDT